MNGFFLDILFQFVSSLWYIFVLIFLIGLYKIFKPRIKGVVGEKAVASLLMLLNNEEYKVLNDVVLTYQDGTTTQIDHIVVSKYGIFVLETKNYKGWIIGKEKDKYWKQVIYKTKNSFYNPIRQNYAHEMAIKEVLGEPKVKVIPIVVFSVNSTLKVKVSKEVIYTSRLIKTIKKYRQEEIKPELVAKYHKMLQTGNALDKNIRAKHIESVKEKARSVTTKCPNCNGSLKKRSGRYGSFYGCTNYSRCKYTVNLY